MSQETFSNWRKVIIYLDELFLEATFGESHTQGHHFVRKGSFDNTKQASGKHIISGQEIEYCLLLTSQRAPAISLKVGKVPSTQFKRTQVDY